MKIEFVRLTFYQHGGELIMTEMTFLGKLNLQVARGIKFQSVSGTV